MRRYRGVIKQSRTLDLAAVSVVVDAVGLALLAYEPEQLGVTVPVYFGVRVVLTGLAAYLRFKTKGPVGAEPPA